MVTAAAHFMHTANKVQVLSALRFRVAGQQGAALLLGWCRWHGVRSSRRHQAAGVLLRVAEHLERTH